MAKRRPDKSDKREPYNYECTRIEAAEAFAKEKAQAGKAPLEVELGFNEAGEATGGAPHSDTIGQMMVVRHAFGTMSGDFAEHQMGRLLAVMRNLGEEVPSQKAANAAFAAVCAVEPENEVEAQLAVQMTATHEVAMEMLTRAKTTRDSDHLERYGTLATKLLRTYTTQIEALAKLRRGGSQKVVVEHVHVYQGGQAIVGNVTQGGGAHVEKGNQPHALTGPAALALQADPSMLCPDAGREPVPVARSEGQGPLPDARRRQGKRRAQG